LNGICGDGNVYCDRYYIVTEIDQETQLEVACGIEQGAGERAQVAARWPFG
jgi:hypothetical protein